MLMIDLGPNKFQIKPLIKVIMPGAANLRSSWVCVFNNYYNGGK
jgi:hypothetical protein